MMTTSRPAPRRPYDRVDPHELDRAWLLLRDASVRFDRIAQEEGWPTPFPPVRYLILTHLEKATAYGQSAGRLAHLLSIGRSTLAYHLEALEHARLVRRGPWTVHDRRKVAVRLTEDGRYAARRLGGGV